MSEEEEEEENRDAAVESPRPTCVTIKNRTVLSLASSE